MPPPLTFPGFEPMSRYVQIMCSNHWTTAILTLIPGLCRHCPPLWQIRVTHGSFSHLFPEYMLTQLHKGSPLLRATQDPPFRQYPAEQISTSHRLRGIKNRPSVLGLETIHLLRVNESIKINCLGFEVFLLHSSIELLSGKTKNIKPIGEDNFQIS